MNARGWYRRVVLARPGPSFAVMTAAFLAFGLGTLNLVELLRANLALLAEHGWLAAMEGGALQLLQLVGSAVAAMLAWVLFKSCEQALVGWLNSKP